MKKTLILGASTNPNRYAYIAAQDLHKYKHDFVLLGIKEGQVLDKNILTGKPNLENEAIDTITLYVGPKNQPEWYDYLLNLKPKRIIFNPGTENQELAALAQQHGIETLEACTLVMLATGQY